jgi:hypothetical protein
MLNRVVKGSLGLSINQVLQAAFCVLNYEKVTLVRALMTIATQFIPKHVQSQLSGASVMSADDAYIKLKRFKSRLSLDPAGNL